MNKTTAPALLAAVAFLAVVPLSAAAAPAPALEPPPEFPGLCFIYTGGGWVGAACPDPVDPADPVDPVTTEPADPVTTPPAEPATP